MPKPLNAAKAMKEHGAQVVEEHAAQVGGPLGDAFRKALKAALADFLEKLLQDHDLVPKSGA